MFKNPGKQLKTLATIILILDILVGFLAGLVVGGLVSAQTDELLAMGVIMERSTADFAVPLVVCTLAGTLIGWMNGLLLYAFGALVEDTETQRTQLMGLCLDVAAIRAGMQTTTGHQ